MESERKCEDELYTHSLLYVTLYFTLLILCPLTPSLLLTHCYLPYHVSGSVHVCLTVTIAMYMAGGIPGICTIFSFSKELDKHKT